MLMRAAKKCSPDTRSTAAQSTLHSEVMRTSQPLWKALKAEQLRPLFEVPDVVHNEDIARKRQKR